MTLAIAISTIEKAFLHSVNALAFVNASPEITVKLAPSNAQLSFTTTPPTLEIGKLVILTARLTDENGAPIENAEITFRLKNLIGIVTTGSDGTATFGFTPQASGNYEVKVEYAGSSRYSHATKTGIISVQTGIEFLYLSIIVVTAVAVSVTFLVAFYKHRRTF
jgi:hypothetical protein